MVKSLYNNNYNNNNNINDNNNNNNTEILIDTQLINIEETQINEENIKILQLEKFIDNKQLDYSNKICPRCGYKKIINKQCRNCGEIYE